MHLATDSVHALAPHADYERIVTMLRLYGSKGTEKPRLGKSSRLEDLDIMFTPPLRRIQGSVHRLS